MALYVVCCSSRGVVVGVSHLWVPPVGSSRLDRAALVGVKDDGTLGGMLGIVKARELHFFNQKRLFLSSAGFPLLLLYVSFSLVVYDR
eukprot:scaffold1690_cov182-Amphora_coffeaeformis.AAC.47